MKNLIIYVHGKGGSAGEAEYYKMFFPNSEVIGFDYCSQTLWEAKKEFFAFFTTQRSRFEHITLVANSIGAFFGISSLDETLVDRAYLISPIVDMEKLICNMDYEGENFMNLLFDEPLKKSAIGNCLSTATRTNGAVAVFLPGVAQRLSDLLDGGFYMVFTSIHEVMIHSEKTADPKDLKRVLADTVRDTTPDEDFLTYYVYHYNHETGQFTYY